MNFEAELERTLVIQETPGRIILIHPNEANVDQEDEMPMSLDTSLGVDENGSKVDDDMAKILVAIVKKMGAVKSDSIFKVGRRRK